MVTVHDLASALGVRHTAEAAIGAVYTCLGDAELVVSCCASRRACWSPDAICHLAAASVCNFTSTAIKPSVSIETEPDLSSAQT
jgi:hypothetical protein